MSKRLPIGPASAGYRKKSIEWIDSRRRQLAGVSDEDLKAVARDAHTLPETFAVTAVLAERLLGFKMFHVQLHCALALADGKIAEMQTGEGKTLSAVPAAVWLARAGKGVHVMTVNDYLARRDAGWMKPILQEAFADKPTPEVVGIVHERIQPGRPQQNGCHERMHRTLKEDTTNPAALTLRLQQRKFDRFRQMYNHERPHEGLNNQTPGSLYHPSSLILPRTLIEYAYPKEFLTRRVNNSGDISWHKGRVFISEVFRFGDLGFEMIGEGLYRVFFRERQIGEFDVEALRFRAAQVLR